MKFKNMRFNRHDINYMTDTANVMEGYQYWFDKLLAYVMNIFKYDNLPESLNHKSIESQLILLGYATFFKSKKYGLVTTQSELFGFDEYYNPTNCVYAQPRLLSKTLKINDDCVIVYNCDLETQVLGSDIDGSLRSFIARYARMLSDIESTISISLVDMRVPSIAVSNDDETIESVKRFYDYITLGKRTVVVDSNIVPNLRNEDISRKPTTDKILDLLQSRDKILASFFREIGVKFYQNEKKAQVNVEEVNANDSMLLISIDDLLEKRKEGITKVNEKFGTNISVRLNEKWQRGNDDENV